MNQPSLSAAGFAARRRSLGLTGGLFICTAALGGAALFVQSTLIQAAGLSVVMQFFAWTVCLGVLVNRVGMRLSDPAQLTLIWAGLYLLYPTYAWVTGVNLPYVGQISPQVATTLFWHHTAFIVAFTGAYLISGGAIKNTFHLASVAQLPKGNFLFFLPLLILLGTVALSVFSGSGGLGRDSTYSSEWFSLQDKVAEARASGGSSYLLAQITGKAYFIPILLQGAGVTFMLMRTKKGTSRTQTLLLISGSISLLLFVGRSSRSSAMAGLIIAIVLYDILRGPISLKVLLPTALAGLLVFVSWGYFREFTQLGVSKGARAAAESATSDSAQGPMDEFTSMLSKEAISLRRWSQEPKEGGTYFLQSAISFIPSQLVPEKLSEPSTADQLSISILGQEAARGAGVAGAIVADGIRVGGILGVSSLAFVLGWLFATANRWLLSNVRHGVGPNLLKACLAAGLYSWTFDAIRGDLGILVNVTVYYVIIPYLLLSLLASNSQRWLKPLRASFKP